MKQHCKRRNRYVLTLSLAAMLVLATTGLAAESYEIGGPLAGVKLPLCKTQHGEPPGYPGCIPALAAKGQEVQDVGVTYHEYGQQGLAPEFELYPGSVERWRAYWFKYCPVRSFFDRQSQIKNFVAPDIPGATDDQCERYAEPVYWVPRHSPAVNTGYKNRPVSVVRCEVKSPILKLDLGELEVGLYAVRIIGAVETKELRPFLKPIYVRMQVNDGPKGETGEYRVRIPYNDQFYSVAEMHFHAIEKRRFQASLFVDEGSQTDLLVHNVSLDDALAGTVRQRIKSGRTLATHKGVAKNLSESYIGKRKPLGREERWHRDEAIWSALPPLNKHSNDRWSFFDRKIAQGAGGQPLEAIQKTHGKWEIVKTIQGGTGRENHIRVFPKQLDHLRRLMVNQKLGLVYTIDDLRHNRPLPDPYPYKDDGAGVYEPDPAAPEKGLAFCPLSWAVTDRLHSFAGYFKSGGGFFLRKEENQDYARDSAIALIRFAYQFPTIDLYRCLSFRTVDPAARGRYILRRRMTMASVWGNFIRFLKPVREYDALFDYLEGNEDLARSVARFVPWVKTPDDVLMLLDVYLVQTMAKRMLLYHYYGDGRQPSRLAELAALAGNSKITDLLPQPADGHSGSHDHRHGPRWHEPHRLVCVHERRGLGRSHCGKAGGVPEHGRQSEVRPPGPEALPEDNGLPRLRPALAHRGPLLPSHRRCGRPGQAVCLLVRQHPAAYGTRLALDKGSPLRMDYPTLRATRRPIRRGVAGDRGSGPEGHSRTVAGESYPRAPRLVRSPRRGHRARRFPLPALGNAACRYRVRPRPLRHLRFAAPRAWRADDHRRGPARRILQPRRQRFPRPQYG